MPSGTVPGPMGKNGPRSAFFPPEPGRERLARFSAVRRLANALALAFAIYGFAGWAYVAVISVVAPTYLPMQLTHLASWPRTDTFGEASFAVSFVAFLIYRLSR